MATSTPISDSSGLIPGNVLTTIFYAQGTDVVSKINNIKYVPNDVVTPYTIKVYISLDSGVSDILIMNRTMSAGDMIDDSTKYFLTSEMRLKVLVDANNVVSYTISGELITP